MKNVYNMQKQMGYGCHQKEETIKSIKMKYRNI